MRAVAPNPKKGTGWPIGAAAAASFRALGGRELPDPDRFADLLWRPGRSAQGPPLRLTPPARPAAQARLHTGATLQVRHIRRRLP